MTATTTPARYFATRSAGRYRVFETQADGTEVEVSVHASKAKAQEKADKLNAEGTPFTAEENAALDAAAADELAAEQAVIDAAEAAREEAWGNPPVPAMAEAAKPAKAEATTKAYRIGKLLREWVLAHPQDTDALLVDHVATRNVCYDDTATLRVTFQWAAELSAAATALENAALAGDEGGIPAAHRAPSVRAARAARTGLVKLFA